MAEVIGQALRKNREMSTGNHETRKLPLGEIDIENIRALQSASPSVKHFVAKASGHLGLMAEVLKVRSLANTNDQTVEYIVNLASKVHLDSVTPGVADLRRDPWNPKYIELERVVGKKITPEKSVRVVQRNYGTLTHTAVTKLSLIPTSTAPRYQLSFWKNPSELPSDNLSPVYCSNVIPHRVSVWMKLFRR